MDHNKTFEFIKCMKNFLEVEKFYSKTVLKVNLKVS